MNYLGIVTNRRKQQRVVRRVLISWLVILLIGGLIGFFIGKSTKQVIALPTSTQTPIQEEPTTKLVSLGEFIITAYCPCEICCGNWAKNRPIDEDGSIQVFTASGDLAVEGVTIAADTSILPFGTEVIIDGNRYIVQDRGRVIKDNRIDVYFENHQDALEFGVQYKEIFIERMIEND